MEELRIKCPSCGIVLDVRNSKNEDVKRIVCPNCHKHLAVTFHESSSSHPSQGVLYYGAAAYPLKEGIQVIGLKDPASKADIQIATGDPSLMKEHAVLKVVPLHNGGYKYIVSSVGKNVPVFVNNLPLQEDDEVVLNIGDELKLGDTVLDLKILTE